MLIVNKRAFTTGSVMAVGFGAVLVAMFLPLLDGKTPLEAADDFFNRVSKDSSYYIPKLKEEAEKHRDAKVEMRLTLKDGDLANKVAMVLRAGGAETSAAGAVTTVRGKLGELMLAALDDSAIMFQNEGEALAKKRGLPAKEAMFAWHEGLKQMNKEYRALGDGESASVIEEVLEKGVEVSYNFYGITPSPVSKNVGILSLSLVFYLVYTMWWGYAIMYLSDGIGLQMKSHGKREH